MGFPKGDPVAYLATILRPGDVVIDGGANVGEVSKRAAQLVGDKGRVVAVEPDPRCHEGLTSLRVNFPQIEIIAAALSRDATPAVFYQASQSPQSSRLPMAVPHRLEGAAPIQVSCVTLDGLIRRIGRPIRAIKLDLQGGEPDALAGAWSALRVCDHWIVEYWPSALRDAGTTPTAFIQTFRQVGLQPHWMTDPLTPCTDGDPEAWGEAVTAPHQFVNLVCTR